MRLGVKAALVDRRLVPGDIEVVDGRIVAYGLASPNGKGIAAPGFIDLQVNGFAGVDFLAADADGYRLAGEGLLETGVTAYLPTLITSPEEQLVAALREVPRTSVKPRILGVHLEGPFLSPRRLGTHPASARRDPDIALLALLLDAGANVRIVTLAPELPGASLLIPFLHSRGVVVSLGHSDATAEEAHLAFDDGVHCVTHLFNAMRPFRHRDPGIVGAALIRDDVTVGLIVDGIHIAPETVKIVWRAAAGRVALITDAVAGAGLSDGAYSLGAVRVKVIDRAVRGPSGILAGSVLTMIDSVRNLHELGVPLPDALHAASTVPARVLGLDAVIGRISTGLPADLVVLTESVELHRVIVGGREVAHA